MDEAIKVFEEIFQLQLKEDELEKEIGEVLDWDSFTIMEFMSEISERYNKTIDIVQLSAIDTIQDVLELIFNCMK